MADRLGPHTITRLRPTMIEDPNHNTLADWDRPDAADIEGCSVQPSGATTLADDGRIVATLLGGVWAPVGADVTTGDRVRFAGVTYDVDGIEPWYFPPLDHLVIRLLTRKG